MVLSGLSLSSLATAQVEPEKVEAACKDGILTITLAKPEVVKPRQITVKSA
mgnify:CR=1 FL=1